MLHVKCMWHKGPVVFPRLGARPSLSQLIRGSLTICAFITKYHQLEFRLPGLGPSKLLCSQNEENSIKSIVLFPALFEQVNANPQL